MFCNALKHSVPYEYTRLTARVQAPVGRGWLTVDDARVQAPAGRGWLTVDNARGPAALGTIT
jgi:hypothetical protein